MASHRSDPASTTERASSAILTIPNALSFVRIALIPVFVWLILDHDTSFGGLLLFAAVASTDWVDGAVARATDQVSELGKVLDPVADRLSIAAGLIALIVRGAFPLWAALLILVRDGMILIGGLALLAGRGARIEVRYIGKVATFCLMSSIAAIAWGNLGYGFDEGFLVIGWSMFTVGIVDSYVATALYIGDMRRALTNASRR
jgi:cardiolipin synthase (CMP-forming)